MQPIKINRYINKVSAWLFGSEDAFTMQNRLFNIASISIAALMVVFLAINALLQVWGRSIIILNVLTCEAIFYYFSRFKKKFKISIVLNGLVSYVALSCNYLINSGMDGPTVFIFFFTISLLVSCTPAKMHGWWLALHAFTVTGLLIASTVWPVIGQNNYSGRSARFADIFICYFVTAFLIYFVTRYLRNYYFKEKHQTEGLQTSLKAFFDSAQNYHVLLNREKKLIYFNQAAAQVVKALYGSDLKNGSEMQLYVNPTYAERLNGNINKALNGQTVVEDIHFNYNTLGIVWWQISYMPAKNNDGDVVAASINSVNINDRKAKEEKIFNKNQALLKIAQIQSNGLREPVASIIGLMNLIKEDETRANEYLQHMEESAKELDKKIHEIVAQTQGAYRDEQ